MTMPFDDLPKTLTPGYVIGQYVRHPGHDEYVLLQFLGHNNYLRPITMPYPYEDTYSKVRTQLELMGKRHLGTTNGSPFGAIYKTNDILAAIAAIGLKPNPTR